MALTPEEIAYGVEKLHCKTDDYIAARIARLTMRLTTLENSRIDTQAEIDAYVAELAMRMRIKDAIING